ncbi:Proteasome subunit beta [Candidatus Lokiarchaeum ossiferum]|uniref:Proteasome subunit beta n=1 Tax=Candidatus Lokiarchaeum ossiferum TaxID=2951803 RepID=A0ABY6HV70_9ARCH|nr:Proteasome subunit beta [Candidatus Lokiarchaeum sp. B-35]
MDQLPNQTNIDMNILKITPESADDFKVEQLKALPKMKTGTTTVALLIKDGVVLATDNRATMGMYVANKNAKKLHMIQPHMYITIAGSVADAQYLIDLLKAETEIYKLRNDHDIGVGQTAKLLQNILYNNKGYFQVGHLLGGYTDKEGGAIYNLGGYGSLLEEKYASVGSGSPFAIGVLETDWKEDLSAEDGMILAARAVRSAIIRDIASGNGIDIIALQKGQAPIEKRYEITDIDIRDNKIENKKKKVSKKKTTKSK